MSNLENGMRQSLASGGKFAFLWRHKFWWLLSLGVLLLLIGVLYVLAHLSSADPEMYPTTLRYYFSSLRSC